MKSKSNYELLKKIKKMGGFYIYKSWETGATFLSVSILSFKIGIKYLIRLKVNYVAGKVSRKKKGRKKRKLIEPHAVLLKGKKHLATSLFINNEHFPGGRGGGCLNIRKS